MKFIYCSISSSKKDRLKDVNLKRLEKQESERLVDAEGAAGSTKTTANVDNKEEVYNIECIIQISVY